MARIQVCGHSFVARHRSFLLGNTKYRTTKMDFAKDYGLPREKVYVSGRSGLKLDYEGAKFIRECALWRRPHLMVLEIGTNDIADKTADVEASCHAEFVAQKLVRLVDDLHRNEGVKKFVVCKIIQRRRYRGVKKAANEDQEQWKQRKKRADDEFETMRQCFNEVMAKESMKRPHLMTFTHGRSAMRNLSRDVSKDQIHCTTGIGQQMYHFSMRRAVAKGLQRAKKNGLF